MDRIRKSTNFYLGLVVATVLAVALIVAVASNNSTKKLSAGTPERVVQEYLQSLSDGRNDLAVRLLTSDSSCSIQDLDRASIWPSAQISLLKSQTTGNTAVVRVSLQRDTNAMMDTSLDEELTYRLAREGDQWRISGIPWPLYDCGGVKK